MTEYIEERSRDEGHENVVVILAEPDDPMLPPAGVDLVFTSNTYHHIGERPAYFGRLQAALRPGGRVAIVEYHAEDGWLHRIFGDHATSGDTIRDEMTQAGYRLSEEFDFLERQSFLVFTPDR